MILLDANKEISVVLSCKYLFQLLSEFSRLNLSLELQTTLLLCMTRA